MNGLELVEAARLAETYGDGTVRLGTDQNITFTGVPEDRIDALLAEDLLPKYSPYPGPVQPGAWWPAPAREFCRYAIVETKERAVKWARFLDEQLAGEPVGRRPVPGAPFRPSEDAGVIRMHFSGCSASCAQPQIADIGFRGEVAHVGNHLAEAVDIGMGGSLGADAGFIDWIEHARPVNDVPDALLRVVRRYQSERRDDEPFYNWARRVPNDDLRPTLAERAPARRWPWRTKPKGPAAMKAYRIRDEINGIAEPPGKTWFWELQAGVIDAGRCIQCGTCVAACPSNSIGIDEDTDLPELVKMCTGCSLCWDFCPRGGLRYEALWPPSTALTGADPTTRSTRRRRGPGRRRRQLLEDHRGPPGDGLGAVIDVLRGAGRGPTRRRPGRRGGLRPAHRRPGRRGHRRRPGHPAERRSRRALEGRGPPGHHGQGDHRRGRQLLQPDHGPGRAGPVPVRPAGQAPHRRGGHAVRDPGDPGHAVPPLAHRGPPDRRRGPDHRPAVHQELRLRGPHAPAARAGPGHRPRAGAARSTSSGGG